MRWLLWRVFFGILYACFFQGPGWNQNSQFDSIRAIVEEGRFDITDFASNTGDVGYYDGRVYSNKLPGMSFLGAPFYWAMYRAERLVWPNPNSKPLVTTRNAYVLTFLLSGVPGVILLLILFHHFRRRGASTWEAFFLASAFGGGSLLLPYSGVMMNHILIACLLFGAWHLLSGPELTPRCAAIAGLLSGLGVLTESLATPVSALFLGYLLMRNRRNAAMFLTGLIPISLLLAGYDFLCFGNIFVTDLTVESQEFTHTGYLFGVLQWPQPMRIYWLTLHPFRGLFYCCPVLLIGLLSLRWPPRIRAASPKTLVALLVVGGFFSFNMTFNYWASGASFGPRYLMPATPFLYSFALTGYRRFPIVSGCLAAISAVFVLAPTAVGVMIPSVDGAPPPPLVNPVFDCIRQLLAGQLLASSLPGKLLGLRGLWCLVPLLLVFLAFCRFAWRVRLADKSGR